MSILSFFTGGGIKAIENIASEWIETDLESAEAKVLMVKTLDPNGMMRRELSRKVSQLYTLYVVTALILLICESFGLGFEPPRAPEDTNVLVLALRCGLPRAGTVGFLTL